MRPLLAGLFLVALGAPAAAAAPDQDAAMDTAVAAASAASGLPETWIRRVIVRESGGDPRAVSPAGALGLMQLMPATWAEMRARLGLGVDPFDVRDNVLAGAAYLRQMLDRFGAPGFLAAYNAGPERYARTLSGRSALPPETRAYVARLAPELGVSSAPGLRIGGAWRAPGLFPSGAGLIALAGEPRP
jgi:soluble lytic murein transglycosylase-like protein